MGIPDEEITFHEDAWAGGGNFGPCMEFFSRGVELGNQVYMLYEQTDEGSQELKLKVLDMGMGMERCAWFSQGTPTIYDAVFPTVVEKLMNATSIKPNKELIKKFVPFAGMLNTDEVEDISKAWMQVAKKVGVDVKTLKKEVIPLAAVYSIAEHARGLLIALSDGALPSNVGGGYNLRILARRAFSFIDKYKWNIYLPDVARWHAEYLKPLFPELCENLDEVKEILEVEKNKYEATKHKSKGIVERIIKTEISEKKLLELYDSHGIAPEIIKEEAEKLGKKITYSDNFYSKVAELHEKKEQVHATKKEDKLDLSGVEETEALYFDDYSKTDFKAKVVRVIDDNIILDKTNFYPTSGGQLHDTGTIDGHEVINVFKQGNIIVHIIKGHGHIPEGHEIECKIDPERRKQLAQHHTATHILNAATKRVLGNHINQAGAKKTLEKAHLDVTHYQSIPDEELDLIERESNKIIREDFPIRKSFMLRNEAEKKYGLLIYQGGAVPGKNIRIVEIPEVDVEACGGTHLNKTSEVGEIKILKSTKISDSIVRIEFTAGTVARKEEHLEKQLVDELAALLKVKEQEIPARVEELFRKWKIARKAAKKNKNIDVRELELFEKEDYDGDVLDKAADIFKTQPEHLIKTTKRFLKELDEFKEKLK
jgi:alanine--tRNA ligase